MNNICTFIGGIKDGLRMAIPDDVNLFNLKYPIGSETETYTRRRLCAGEHNFSLFVVAWLADADMISQLIARYPGMGTPNDNPPFSPYSLKWGQMPTDYN